MLMNKARAAKATKAPEKPKPAENEIPEVSDFLKDRDYAGAIALLEFKRQQSPSDVSNLEWLAYAYFHAGDPEKALDTYRYLLRRESDPDPTYHTFAAACLFYLGQYDEAEEEAKKGPKTKLHTRVLFHCAHKQNDEAKLMTYHQQLTDSVEDQLSLASIHYLRSHFQEATDIYKRLLLENREHLALNVYVALCYCKLEYYDVSLEILNVYLQSYPDSPLAINLKACNHFRLYNGAAAEAELKKLQDHVGKGGSFEDNDLIRHNLVVFRGGENAMKVLPPLRGFPPEAKLNLVVHYLRNGKPHDAFTIVKEIEPSTPTEYILKGVTHAIIGQQEQDGAEHLKMAQQCFQIVGSSSSECDTIPGRQSMASCFFLLKQFEDVLTYLKSVADFCGEDDAFHWNYGIATAATGDYKTAEESFMKIQSPEYRTEYCYLAWMARCFINNGKASLAWELYAEMDTNDESFALLQLIANDCYKVGAFFYATKAFDVLERLNPHTTEYWEGKRGAAAGVFQMVIAGKEAPETLSEVLDMLQYSSNPQVELFVRAITRWGNDNGVRL